MLGRDSDILISPDGVQLTGIDHFQRDVANVVRIQVIQEAPDEVRVLVLPDDGYSERDAAQLLHNVRTKLPDSMRVDIRRADALERTDSGKMPFVIHRPPVRELLSRARSRGAGGVSLRWKLNRLAAMDATRDPPPRRAAGAGDAGAIRTLRCEGADAHGRC